MTTVVPPFISDEALDQAIEQRLNVRERGYRQRYRTSRMRSLQMLVDRGYTQYQDELDRISAEYVAEEEMAAPSPADAPQTDQPDHEADA